MLFASWREEICLVGLYLRLGPQSSVLDIACGKAGPAVILAHECGCRIHGVEVSAVFAAAARCRIDEAGPAELISVEVADASQISLEPGSSDVALCFGAAFVWGHTFVDLPRTVARFEATGVDVTGMVAASEDDWDHYESLHWRAAVEAGGDEVLQTHLRWRDNYLTAQRAELGWRSSPVACARGRRFVYHLRGFSSGGEIADSGKRCPSFVVGCRSLVGCELVAAGAMRPGRGCRGRSPGPGA